MHWVARSQAGAVATGQYLNMANFVFKTIDIAKRADGLAQFEKEVSFYKHLEDLQGVVIPSLITYENLGCPLQVIVLENVGVAIEAEEARLRADDIEHALRLINERGVVHNDLRLPNIL
jgi:hypothetical protein